MVEDILSKGGGCHGNIVKEIVATATELVSCSFIHEARQSNKEAHSLAKHALGLDAGRHLWLIQPPTFVSTSVNVVNQ